MIIRRRVEIVKCLAEFYGRPVPSTLSVADILISSFFSSKTIYVSHQYKNVKQCILVNIILFILRL